jgi:hypothetical protein
MAVTTGAFGTNNAVTVARAATFIPDIWSDEIVAAYKRELVMAAIARKISVKGKKGDVFRIPAPSRGIASAKVAGALVTIQQDTESEVSVALTQHWEYSRFIEDIAATQALDSMRMFYTDDAGFALARRVDSALIELGRSANNGGGTAAYNTAFIGGDGNTLYTSGTPNATAMTSVGLRRMVQRCDDADLPMSGRFLVLPPVARNVLMGINDYVAQSFVGEVGANNTIRNGQIGDLYGIPVFVTPNCDVATGAARVGLIGHKDSIVLVEQMAPRSQIQYKQEYLSTLYTSDLLFGVQNLRTGSDPDIPAGLFAIAMPA